MASLWAELTRHPVAEPFLTTNSATVRYTGRVLSGKRDLLLVRPPGGQLLSASRARSQVLQFCPALVQLAQRYRPRSVQRGQVALLVLNGATYRLQRGFRHIDSKTSDRLAFADYRSNIACLWNDFGHVKTRRNDGWKRGLISDFTGGRNKRRLDPLAL
jgi:hypothetical protein